jgi:xanthine dehydrogenase accessory factor
MLLDILRELIESLTNQRPLAYCRLVETRGSTPQKAGAAMLVYADGTQAGTLGGGCVEAEVKRQAIAILGEGFPRIIRFQLDSDYGWDDGLICGGRMHVLIAPLGASPEPAEYFRRLFGVAERAGGTEIIAFDADKTPLPVPSAYLLDEAGQLLTTLFGPDDRPEVLRQHLQPLASRPRPHAAAGLSYLPLIPRCRLLIVGGGHVGQAVCRLASEVDFDVWVLDDRADMVSQQRFPRAQRRLHGSIEALLQKVEVTPDTYCLIVTRGHNHDEKALYYLAERGARYVGLIGSRRKLKMIFDDLRDEGVAAAALEQVFAPVGIDIGSQTVAEIAVSIVAELVAHRNLGRVPGRPEPILRAEKS